MVTQSRDMSVRRAWHGFCRNRHYPAMAASRWNSDVLRALITELGGVYVVVPCGTVHEGRDHGSDACVPGREIVLNLWLVDVRLLVQVVVPED